MTPLYQQLGFSLLLNLLVGLQRKPTESDPAVPPRYTVRRSCRRVLAIGRRQIDAARMSNLVFKRLAVAAISDQNLLRKIAGLFGLSLLTGVAGLVLRPVSTSSSFTVAAGAVFETQIQASKGYTLA